MWLKTTIITLWLMVPLGLEFWSSLALQLCCLHGVAITFQQGMPLSESLTGARLSTPQWITHMASKLMLAVGRRLQFFPT